MERDPASIKRCNTEKRCNTGRRAPVLHAASRCRTRTVRRAWSGRSVGTAASTAVDRFSQRICFAFAGATRAGEPKTDSCSAIARGAIFCRAGAFPAINGRGGAVIAMAGRSGQSSNFPPGARLRDRPSGRPIGGMGEAHLPRDQRVAEKGWRKRWDSNPRSGCPLAGFQDRFLKPLGHSSSLFRV